MLVTAIEGHRLWAASYDTAPNPLLALEDRLLPDVLRAADAHCVVDVACGTGRWTTRLSAVGIDLCEEMLVRAAGKPGLSGRLMLADSRSLPVADGVADLTFCSFAVGYFAELDQAVSELARITRLGGRVVISDLHPASLAAGWTRSFRAEGEPIEMRHYAHSVGDILLAARMAGLSLESHQDACFGTPEESIFEAAGKAMPEIPALWIASWTR